MSTAFIIFFIVFAIGITFCDEHLNDEMYCKRFHQKFQICRKCPNMEEDCETSLPSDSCQCDHIQLYKQDGFIGGADCNSTLRNRPYCYVNGESNCQDTRPARFANSFERKWYKGSIGYSVEACKAENIENQKDVGNELALPGFQITSNILDDGFEVDSPDDCQENCIRRGICGAWSFTYDLESEKNVCQLHSSNACCNQFTNRKKVQTSISGYICPHCWSTRRNCPCSEKERRPDGGGIELCSACSSVKHGTSTGAVTYQVRDGRYKSGCRWKFIRNRRSRSGNWRCIPKRRRN